MRVGDDNLDALARFGTAGFAQRQRVVGVSHRFERAPLDGDFARHADRAACVWPPTGARIARPSTAALTLAAGSGRHAFRSLGGAGAAQQLRESSPRPAAEFNGKRAERRVMSLERYRLDRVLVQNQGASVYDAVRAMESNHVGLVVVTEHGRLVGVLTDRDVALRVAGFQLDPAETRLQDVMTEHPAALPIGASEREALELMRDRHVRRIPLVEGDAIVGVVTLDDLILSKTVDRDPLREVIRAQLAEPAVFKPRGELHPVKPARYPTHEGVRRAWTRVARAQQTTDQALRLVQMTTHLETQERAFLALDIVTSAIVRRVTAGEAKDMLSQLPSELRERWLDLPAGPDRDVTRQSVVEELRERLSVDADRADELAGEVGLALSALISEGELDHLRGQLPEGLRELL